jgi:hypothetical protein
MNGTQLFMAVGMPTLAVLIGIPINHWRVSAINARITGTNARVGDLRQDMNTRFDDLKDTWRAELRRVEEVIDARLKHFTAPAPTISKCRRKNVSRMSRVLFHGAS